MCCVLFHCVVLCTVFVVNVYCNTVTVFKTQLQITKLISKVLSSSLVIEKTGQPNYKYSKIIFKKGNTNLM